MEVFCLELFRIEFMLIAQKSTTYLSMFNAVRSSKRSVRSVNSIEHSCIQCTMQRRESRHYVVSDAQYATASGERVLNRHNQTSFVHESISQKKKNIIFALKTNNLFQLFPSKWVHECNAEPHQTKTRVKWAHTQRSVTVSEYRWYLLSAIMHLRRFANWH